ncbi:galectin-5-like isoform X1 [Mya arenaria]|uniref:galectin-5-like n=1 Tax=Mya arenaria TaxID=6604 RepID=UPI0022DF37EA|nr:galectin-5-like [Mya arenaria]XP_052767166.1 galectin-5-like isoform X1 [Mya arenaria]
MAKPTFQTQCDFNPIFNPPVPFVQNFGGLYPNKMIVISGIPIQRSKSRFTINFEHGDDIAFHFDVRFDGNVIVRNTQQRGIGWGREERDSAWFPFSHDVWFEMVIKVETSNFKVAVNNQHLLEYCHRLQPLGRFDSLRITGDLRLTQVRFHG